MFRTLFDAFDTAARPLLLKCSGGQDRTSFAAALYLVHRCGWTAFAEAQAQLASWPYLHWPRDEQRWLRLFLVHAQEEARAQPLRRWIESSYSQEKFRDWLDARGFKGSFRDFHH
jgi:protein tyrosine/serine phosphatase